MNTESDKWTMLLLGAFAGFVAAKMLDVFVFIPEVAERVAETTANCIKNNEIPYDLYRGCQKAALRDYGSGGGSDYE
jgi:hypothetical protein